MEECVIAPNLGKPIIDSFTKGYIIDFSEHGKQFTLRIKLNKSKRTADFIVILSHTIPIICLQSRCTYNCNMNAFFSFDLFMVYIPKCKQQLGTMKKYT
jgi:hypothetical protein